VGLLLVVSFSGCSGGTPTLKGAVPVTGTVTYNGNPVEGAMVGFLPADKQTGKPANAVTNAEGKFELNTYVAGTNQVSGALPGDYSVTIIKASGSAGEAPQMDNYSPATAPLTSDASDPQGATATTLKAEIPAKYADPEKSRLSVTVKPSGNEPLTFALTDE
jgi:hypothetical protein